ncbi:hypothetical protein [Peterkaempfera sp. SMS 1(5)a]|uniref:hypothetical protein n=1 Tax=Peterkaempfera podocarpi TaxID=3232308 RepID=UPI00366A938B
MSMGLRAAAGSSLGAAQEIGLNAMIPAPYGAVLFGLLTLCAAEILLGPRRPGDFRASGVGLAALLLFELDGDRLYLVGLVAGSAAMAVPARLKSTRRQLAGFLLQWLMPPLLVFLAFRFSMVGDSAGAGSKVSRSAFLPVFLIAGALAIQVVPAGKKLQWLGFWWSAGRLDLPPGLTAGDWRDRTRYARHPGQSAKRALALWLTGWLGSILSITGAAYGIYLFSPKHYYVLTFSFMAIWAYEGFRKLPLRARRHFNPVLKATTDFRPGSYVLYLRPFAEDVKRGEVSRNMYNEQQQHDLFGELMLAVLSSKDEEEHIADALRPVGPLLAVGGHDAKIPHAGAMRMYLPMDAWRQPVRELIKRARLVVLTLGTTQGTLWEFTEAMRVLPPERLVLLVPGSMDDTSYAKVRRLSRETVTLPALATDLDRNKSIASIIRFSAEWQPSVTHVKNVTLPWQNLFTRLAPALRPSLEQLAAYENKVHRYSA